MIPLPVYAACGSPDTLTQISDVSGMWRAEGGRGPRGLVANPAGRSDHCSDLQLIYLFFDFQHNIVAMQLQSAMQNLLSNFAMGGEGGDP